MLQNNDNWRIKYIINDDIRQNIKSETKQYNILLNNLNSEQGVKNAQINEEETSVFKLSGDAYGVLFSV